MDTVTITQLCGDAQTHEHKVWNDWLAEAAKIVALFMKYEDDPFAYNETASVSILSSAAIKAGLLSIAEYVASKKRRDDRRMVKDGRCDLWVASHRSQWAFEFKQFMPDKVPTLNALETKLAKAAEDARHVHHKESDTRFGVLCVSCFYCEADSSDLQTRLDDFARDADFAWKITPSSIAAPTYFYFLQS